MSSFGPWEPPQTAVSAFAGFTGIVNYGGTTFRVENFGLKATQQIEAVNDVDGTVANGRFVLQPLVIEGDMSFKFDIFSTGGGNGGAGYTVAKQLLTDAYKRNISTGNLEARNAGRYVIARYHSGYSYKYGGVLVNQLKMTVTAGQPVDFSATLKAVSREVAADGDTYNVEGTSAATKLPAPVRVANYNDISITLEDNGSDPTGTEDALNSTMYKVRDFNITIDNQLEDIYTLGGDLRAYDIIAKKRKITGSFKLLSNNSTGVAALRQYIEEHEQRAISRLKMTLNINKGQNNFERFIVLPAVVPSLEDISVSANSVVEMTFNYEAFGHDGGAILGDSGVAPYQNVSFLPDGATGIQEQYGYFPFANL